jgi:hypothetical protein
MIKKNDWIKRIEKSKKKLKEKHTTDAERSEDHYYNDESQKVKFPIYWSSVQVTRSALYSKPPIPEIRSRSNGNDMAKQISKILEEVITCEIDKRDFYADTKRAVLDYLLTDMGVMRIRYDVKTVPQTNEFGQPIIDENGQPMMVIGNQSTYVDHWPWKRFIYDCNAKDWDEVTWICYEHYMSTKEIEKKYKVKINTALDSEYEGDDKGKTIVYELWDKKKKKVYDLIAGKDKPLRVRDDPLKLKDFFDCPKPMISNMRTNKYIPQSDYVQIERQLRNIDMLEGSIDSITKVIKDAGFYDSSAEDLNKLVNAKDGELVPITGLMELLDGNPNFDKIIAKLPIMESAQVLAILQDQKEKQKEQLYEITGLSDIIRGSTKASETATAQQLKGQWANVRLLERQNTINGCWRSIMRLYAEIISEHYTPEQLSIMTGLEVTPEMKQIMSNDTVRAYSIDVETDSTIMADEAQEKQDRTEMVNNMINVMNSTINLPADVQKEMALTAVRGFKHARGLEDIINGMDGTQEQLQQLQQQLQETQMQAQQQIEQTQMQAQEQINQAGQQLQEAGAEVQRLNQIISEFNQQEEQRKNIEVQGEANKDDAQAAKAYAEAEQIQAETRTIGMPQIEVNLQ